jgi:hypothetical protein
MSNEVISLPNSFAMKKTIIIAATFLIFFSCTRNENASLIGKWKLTEELIDIGNGKGEFKKVNAQQTIEFFQDGTFSSTVSLCQVPSGSGEKGTGTYSTDGNTIIPDNCAEDGRGITYEISGSELILNFSCIEPCKQKYVKVIGNR